MSTRPLLVAAGITKQYGGILALDHVDREGAHLFTTTPVGDQRPLVTARDDDLTGDGGQSREGFVDVRRLGQAKRLLGVAKEHVDAPHGLEEPFGSQLTKGSDAARVGTGISSLSNNSSSRTGSG